MRLSLRYSCLLAGAMLTPWAMAGAAYAQKPAGAAISSSASLFTLMPGKSDALIIRLPAADKDGVIARYLYTPSIAGGLGSSQLWLDRARLGASEIIRFRKQGSKVYAEFENTRFLALNGDEGEVNAVKRSFAASPIWSAPIISEGSDGIAVDISGLILRDAMDVAGALRMAKGGNYRLAAPLSVIDQSESQIFPDNAEFEATLAFVSDQPGVAVNRVTPDGHSFGLKIHHSFVRLPGAGYQPRDHDPRTGTSVQIIRNNYAADLDEPIVTRLVRRFRLEKTDPTAQRSPVKKPIVFYVDRAAPEMIRTALQEGAQWWSQAFDAAGFIDAFQVKILPEGVNPMDSRYNVIAWVHRDTRSWSTGSTVVDPRTGEIVRGVVQLGSLRAWQDKLIFEGLAGTANEGKGTADDPIVLVRARLRQLAIHEVGHAIGLSHNFAASTYADRASAMDYPAPRIGIKDGALDFSDAYAVGAGAWDKFAIKWLYSEFAPGTDVKAALNAMTIDALAKGYRFVADNDTRDDGSANPWGNMWDDGPDAVQSLNHVMAVRRIALDKFGLGNLPDGAAVADLQRILVPIYLFHRYQVTAASKLIGGVDYSYAVKGDGHEAASVISADQQKKALKSLLDTLNPAELDLRDDLLKLLSAVQSGAADRQNDIELFGGKTAAAFDWGAAAENAADITLAALLAPERLNRVVLQHAADPNQLSLTDMLDSMTASIMPGTTLSGRKAEISRRIRSRYVQRLLALQNDKAVSSTTLAVLQGTTARLADKLANCRGEQVEKDHCKALSIILKTPVEKPVGEDVLPPVIVPPGAPIGSDEGCWLCEFPRESTSTK